MVALAISQWVMSRVYKLPVAACAAKNARQGRMIARP